jgi:hypothetical protein
MLYGWRELCPLVFRCSWFILRIWEEYGCVNGLLWHLQGGAAVQTGSAAGPSGGGASAAPAQQQNGAAGPSTGAPQGPTFGLV